MLNSNADKLINSLVPYHICVITAANEYQAEGYRKQLEWRKDRDMLPEETEFLVIPDPHGKRIGSGGSTIYVLYKLLERSSLSSIQKKRVLILHSGGDSKRLPAYSAIGKLFIPLPACKYANQSIKDTDGFITLFDLFIRNLMQLPVLKDGQIIVASGDVLLSFDPSEVVFSENGMTGVAYSGSVDVASNHGVYVVSKGLVKGSHVGLRTPVPVSDFLQKPTYEKLKKNNALDAIERAFIDTGIMNFASDAVKILMEASGVFVHNDKLDVGRGSLCESLINGDAYLDIYKEVPFAILGKGLDERETFPINSNFKDNLRNILFYVSLLSSCEFFHVGESKQLLQNFHTINYTASIYGFENFSRSKIACSQNYEDAFIYNSLIKSDFIESKGPYLIEGCYLEGPIKLGGENILTNIPAGARDIAIGKGLCINCVPVKSPKGWVSIIYGIEDDFRKHSDDAEATFLNAPLNRWMEENVIVPSDLWEGGDSHDLWNAKFFPSCPDLGESIRIALSLQSYSPVPLEVNVVSLNVQGPNLFPFTKEKQSGYDLEIRSWLESPRMSMREILQSIDYGGFLDNYLSLCREIKLESLDAILIPASNLSFEEILSWCIGIGDYEKAVRLTINLIQHSSDVLYQARLYKFLSNALKELGQKSWQFDSEDLSDILKFCENLYNSVANTNENLFHSVTSLSETFEDRAFELIREAIAKGLKGQLTNRPMDPKIHIRSDEIVWVSSPARLDFAGGWTDTPPYCLEYGGSVLNASIKLNEQYPIQVIGKLHPEPLIRINSIDQGERITITEMSDVLSFQNPAEWSSLPKAAFIAAGIILDENPILPFSTKGNQGRIEINTSLKDIIKQIGSGIELTLCSALPAGSGLGTSSILGAAVIACLSRIVGRKTTMEELFNRTLYMEQLMTTGGGWQDQIGGIVGGIKLIQTDPGLYQIPRISWTNLDIGSGQFLLYYTGIRRMAKNILQNIIGRYLDREKTTMKTLSQLHEKSNEIKDALDYRDIKKFGRLIGHVWELNKTLDPGTSTDEIQEILSSISSLIYGAKLLGAGGGGFLFIIAKGIEEAIKIRKILEEKPLNDRARFFDFNIDSDGIMINVF